MPVRIRSSRVETVGQYTRGESVKKESPKASTKSVRDCKRPGRRGK